MDNVTIQFGFDKMDFDKVADMLSKTSWSEGIKIEDVKYCAQNSAILAGAFLENNVQVGYARIISDKTQVAYVLDVIVDEDYRRRGIGTKLIKTLLSHDELKNVYQWILKTNVQEFYNKIGFKTVSKPMNWMEIRLK